MKLPINVTINNGEMSDSEVQAYLDYGHQKYPDREITALTITVDGEFVDLKFEFKPDVPFVRIRRITGYLVGTLDRFNNGKKAEEHDRVKHSVGV